MHVTTTTTTVPQPTQRDLGTYSMLAFFIGFLGAGPLYLTFKRDGDGS